MKLEFDVKVTEKDLYSFNIEQAYKGSQGVISLLFAVLLAAAAVLSAQKGNTEYVVLYIIVGILVLLYVPFSLKGRVKMIMKTNEVFSKPLHFEIDEKNIKVSQGEEMAQLPWEQVYRFVANDKRILIFSNRKNAYILSKEQHIKLTQRVEYGALKLKLTQCLPHGSPAHSKLITDILFLKLIALCKCSCKYTIPNMIVYSGTQAVIIM